MNNNLIITGNKQRNKYVYFRIHTVKSDFYDIVLNCSVLRGNDIKFFCKNDKNDFLFEQIIKEQIQLNKTIMTHDIDKYIDIGFITNNKMATINVHLFKLLYKNISILNKKHIFKQDIEIKKYENNIFDNVGNAYITDNLFNKMNVYQTYGKLKKKVHEKLQLKYNLTNYIDKNSPVLVLKLKTNKSAKELLEHKGRIIILWNEKNIDLEIYNIIKNKKDIVNMVTLYKTQKMLNNMCIDNNKIMLDIFSMIKKPLAQKMNKCIVVTSTQYPSYGGAATNSYWLIKYLRNIYTDVYGIFFENSAVDVDPNKFGKIYKLPVFNDRNLIHNKEIVNQINKIKNIIKKPDIILAKNFVAPLLSKKIFAETKIVYLVSGIIYSNIFAFKGYKANDLNTNPELCNELMKDEKIIKIGQGENLAIETSDHIVINSKLCYDIFLNLYKKYEDKIYKHPIDTTLCLNETFNSNTCVKTYDLLLVSSCIKRPEKNNLYIAQLFCYPLFERIKKIIIGENSDMFKIFKNTEVLPLQKQDELMKYMQKSKILLCPSLFDANPNVVREALINGCVPLISNNIGFHELFPDYLVCKSFCHEEWANKIKYILDNYDSVKNVKIDFDQNKKIDDFLLDALKNN